MASTSKIGRNDPCSCGSGKKYKNCCEGKRGRLTPFQWITIGAMALAAGVLLYVVFNMATSDAGSLGARRCPPGQTWHAEHGHCG